eukprot:3019815-Lingulodinium_polyedra.AAC.1
MPAQLAPTRNISSCTALPCGQYRLAAMGWQTFNLARAPLGTHLAENCGGTISCVRSDHQEYNTGAVAPRDH